MEQFQAENLFSLGRDWLLVDVRTPSEYRQGHIPGAVNIPLFDDAERARVGSTYTHINKEAALLLGLEYVGPKLADFVKSLRRLARQKPVLVHCWRGGMRSTAMAWLFEFAGFRCARLEGGYKAYRHWVQQQFEGWPAMVVLGGYTGSGKTAVLQSLAASGQQVIDLEGLACHKGSVFGGLGQKPQPTTEQFENHLAGELSRLDRRKTLWVEDESMKIGTVNLPLPLFRAIRSAPVVFLEVPFDTRCERLQKEFTQFDACELIALSQRLAKRMGYDLSGRVARAISENRMAQAVSLSLGYYDKTYGFGLSQREGTIIRIPVADPLDSSLPGHLVEIAAGLSHS